MKTLSIHTTIQQFNSLEEYFSENVLNQALIVTSQGIQKRNLDHFKLTNPVICHDAYGKGEPKDIKINKMIAEKNKYPHNKIIAIGGGTVMDCAKLMILENLDNCVDAFIGEATLKKSVPLICIPTTAGTGSEVTPITVAELTELKTKKGLSNPVFQPDEAILIPELLKELPEKPFIHASIDALIHATESFLSPKASPATKLFSLDATKKIIFAFQQISFYGFEKRHDFLDDFLLSACFAGIAFGNAGAGAVHALSYPLSGKYHVPHGEANFQFFTAVFKSYYDKAPNGKINELAAIISTILDCQRDHAFEQLESLLTNLIEKPGLRTYGMEEKDILLFTDSVIDEQQRLLANSYVPLSKNDIKMIYSSLY